MITLATPGSRRAVALAFAFAILATAVSFAPASASAAIKLESFEYQTTEQNGSALLRAGAHPDQTVVSFKFEKDSLGRAVESPKDIAVDLPPGSVGSPASLPTCTNGQLAFDACPPDTQVGIVSLGVRGAHVVLPVYNLLAPPGILAQFGFHAQTVVIHLTATVHSLPQYGVTITTRQTVQVLPLDEIVNTFWGVPAAPGHDEDRGMCTFVPHGSGCSISAEAEEVAFLTNPSACSSSSLADARVNSWLEPQIIAEGIAGNLGEAGEPLGVVGCAVPDFSPSIEVKPSTEVADSPAGLHVDLHLPQNDDPHQPAEAQLKDATLLLPEGLTVNSASAAGLGACSPAEVGLLSPVGEAKAEFDESSSTCPDSAKLGSVKVVTPLLKQPLEGSMYLAEPHRNPFGSLLGLYAIIEDPLTGVIIKIAGKAEPDPRTGRLSVSFPDAPQLPFEDFDVELLKGSRAALKTPLTCGSNTTESSLVPWTAPEGPERHPADTFKIAAAPGGGSCPTSGDGAPNSPVLTAGTVNPAAGAYSPFRLKFTRADGTQPIQGLEATLPLGLLGRLAGIPYCPDAALAAAASRSGQEELASPSCPAASRVGSVSVGAGAGPTPLYVGGEAYLAGPYKGAPLSLAIVTPAVAGPFDLGTVVVRTALDVDPETTRIHAVSDPIPTILQGIPLDIRSVSVNLDRPDFTLNPTDCEAQSVGATTLSSFGQSATLSTPFAVGGCNALGFRPRLKLSLGGQTRRTGNPAVKAVLTAPEGGANIASTTVILPRSEFIDQSHVGNPCTRVQFAAEACPAKSVLGTAKAWSPLLDRPLTGPVYFRSNGGERKLPDIVADLHGQIHVVLVGFIDSKKVGREGSRVRTRFASVPDAPVSRFELKLKGGKRGLIENSRNLCRARPRASVQMNGQNGRIADSEPRVQTRCKAAKSRGKKSAGK